MAWIAIDAGTSVVKAVAFNADGREIGLTRERTEVLHPFASASEQSMTDVWQAAVRTAQKAAALLTEPLEGIAITAQGDGCWLVDEQGEPTGNALLWNDGRGATIVEQWRSSGAIENSYRASGSVTYPGLSNTLLAWLTRNDPDRLHRSRHVLSCNGWLFSRLTGKFAADLSDASNPFCDLQSREYDDSIFESYGLAEFRTILPPIARGADLSAPITAKAANLLGVAAGTPVVMAPYDIVTTAYGAGVTNPGQACLILGTTICAEAITTDLNRSGAPAGTTIALDDGQYLRAMPTLAGCETLEWAARLLHAENLQTLETLAASSVAGARNLLLLPYVSEAGERSPFLDPEASGSFHGLKLTHSREDMARAVYEGLTFAIRECLTAAVGNMSELRVCGGGARSAFWCQLIADVTGMRVLRPAESEIGARGAFLFGLVITGRMRNVAHAAATLPTHFETFSPSPSCTLYEAAYKRFLTTRDAMRPLWPTQARS
ncbi:MAG: FGGY-family carbohydrate kinase [Granulicella sp.]